VNWTAILLTLKLAALTAMILLVVGMPIAYWLTYSRRRWKFLVESVVALPLVLPPTVLGFYVLVAIGPKSPVGHWYQAIVGQWHVSIPMTLIMIVAGFLFVSVSAYLAGLIDGEGAITLGRMPPARFRFRTMCCARLITRWLAWPLRRR